MKQNEREIERENMNHLIASFKPSSSCSKVIKVYGKLGKQKNGHRESELGGRLELLIKRGVHVLTGMLQCRKPGTHGRRSQADRQHHLEGMSGKACFVRMRISTRMKNRNQDALTVTNNEKVK